jgi:hypothetical protein
VRDTDGAERKDTEPRAVKFRIGLFRNRMWNELATTRRVNLSQNIFG